ncbi:right-handed parallel beta-helix repeat-containing protein [Streptomyces sp. NPDC057424]|uniref:right-handed parallel beta-helix repeat-containing protein n=1 Tax=Streptomyces sp. NPDC057424 TaxID=3346127 RepID=UPI003673B18D
MPLYTFGGTPADVLTDTAGNVVTNYPLLVKVAGTGATVSALFEVDGTTPISELRSNGPSSPQPGAIRAFKAQDVTEIDYEYLDAGGQPVRWYQAAREVAAGALDAAQAAQAEASTKLDVETPDPQSVDGPVTFNSPISAPNLNDQSAVQWFSVTDAVGDGTTDDRAVIQAQLDAARDAGGGIVYIPPGRTYGISTFLVVYADTTIWAYGATLKAVGNTGLLRNFLSTDLFAGYTGRSRIQILGGTWDGNAADAGVGTVTATTNVISFAHCQDITVRDATITNVSSAHGLEFNSTARGRAINCQFLGFKDNTGGSRAYSEAVQIDMAVSGSVGIGDFDETPSQDILIEGCYVGPSSRLGSFGRGVGSHMLRSGVYYYGIRIIGNRIEDVNQQGIYGFGWRRAVISGNVVSGSGLSGIQLSRPDPAGAGPSEGFTVNGRNIAITGNTVERAKDASGIRVYGSSGGTYDQVVIAGNSVLGLSTDASNGIHVEFCSRPNISGNTIAGTQSTGIVVFDSDGATVGSNTIRNTGSNGVNVTNCAGAQVVGNTVDTTSTNHGIFVSNSSAVAVQANRINAAASAGIRLSTSATGCLVVGNQVRKGSGTTTSGVSLDSSATSAVVLDNDLSGNSWSASTALAVSTAAPVTGPGGMTALPASNVVDSDLTPLPALEAAISPAGRYETTSRLRLGTASTPVSGALYLVPIWLPKGLVVSSITFVSGGTAAVSPTNQWFTLHNSSRVALARTADNTTTAWAANAAKTLNVAQTTAGSASSYTTTYNGLHYLGFMVAAGTMPNIVGEGSLPAAVANAAPGFGSTNSGQTTPPTVTGGAFTAAAFSGTGILAYGYVI